MKTLTNNQSKVLDDKHQDSSHYEHNDIHHLDDKEAIRQELLGKICFSSSATVPQKQNNKKDSSSSRVVGDGGEEVIGHQHDSNEPHHDVAATDITRQQRVCQSKHSQRRAAKWRRSQQT